VSESGDAEVAAVFECGADGFSGGEEGKEDGEKGCGGAEAG
jgi:hypothetical protein